MLVKKAVSVFLVFCLVALSLPFLSITTNAGKSAAEIKAQIIATYNTALQRSGVTSFHDLCATYVNWQLVILGINTSYISGNGNQEYNNYANLSKTSGEYNVIAYPASSYSLSQALNTIVASGNVYNILIGFEKGMGDAGKLYGHTCFIHAIIGGIVYYSDNGTRTVGGVTYSEGSPISCSISTFCNTYSAYVLDGVIYFCSKQAPKWAVLSQKGTLYMKENNISAAWKNLYENVVQFSLTTNRVGILTGSGDVYVKQGNLDSAWKLLRSDIIQIALSGERVGVLTSDGTLYVKEGDLDSGWTSLQTNVKQFSLTDNRVGILLNDGNCYVKSDSLHSAWTLLYSDVTRILLMGERVGVLKSDGTLYVKEGELYSPWKSMKTNVRSFSLSSNRVGVLLNNGNVYVKEGNLDNAWHDCLYTGVNQIALTDYTVGVLKNDGEFLVKEGNLDSNWISLKADIIQGGFTNSTSEYVFTYTVAYNGNGSTDGSTTSSSHTYGTPKALSNNGFTKKGYIFAGWNTVANGSGTVYSNGQSVMNLTTTQGATVMLYAQWTANTYTVAYDANGGTGAPSSQTKIYGTDLTLSTEKPTKSGYVFSGWNTKADGSGTSYASGANYTANANITLYAQWTAVTLNSIAVKTNPSKTSYFVGDTLDTTGLSLTATYNNGTTQTVSSGFTCTPTTLNTAGTQAVTVTYNGKTTTFNVTVTAVTVSGIAVKTMPTKTSYFVGDTLDTSSLTLTATYNNGTAQTVTSGFTCSPTTLNTAGTQAITVTYNGKTTTFNVTVTAVTVSGIEIKTNPTKTSYFVGDLLDTSGLSLTATFNNGTTQIISTGFTCTPTVLNTLGTQTVTVAYGGKTAAFTVLVEDVELELDPDSELQINSGLGALTGVSAGTTAANVLSQFSGGDIKIYKDGEPLGGNDFVGTGCVAQLMDGDEILDSLTVVVKGDLDGDGKVGVPDARKALRAAVKLDTISDFQSLAADVDDNGKVEVPDARLILRVAVGLQGF